MVGWHLYYGKTLRDGWTDLPDTFLGCWRLFACIVTGRQGFPSCRSSEPPALVSSWAGACGPHSDNPVKFEQSWCMSVWEGSAGDFWGCLRLVSHFLLKRHRRLVSLRCRGSGSGIETMTRSAGGQGLHLTPQWFRNFFIHHLIAHVMVFVFPSGSFPSWSLLCSLLFFALTLFGAQFNGSCWWVEGMGESALLIPALGKGQMAQQDFAVWHISDYVLHEELASWNWEIYTERVLWT